MVRGGQANTLLEMGVGEPIKQHPGLVQVTRAVKVMAPGKHFNNLTGAEAAAIFWPRRSCALACTLVPSPCTWDRAFVSQGLAAEHYQGTTRFNLRMFWAEYKSVLPIHYRVYLAEVACKKATAANVETVFSGAGKFTAEVRRPLGSLVVVSLRPPHHSLCPARRRRLSRALPSSRASSSCTTIGSTSSCAPPSRRSLTATMPSSAQRRQPLKHHRRQADPRRHEPGGGRHLMVPADLFHISPSTVSINRDCSLIAPLGVGRGGVVPREWHHQRACAEGGLCIERVSCAAPSTGLHRVLGRKNNVDVRCRLNRLVFSAAAGSHLSILFHLGTARGLYCPLKYSRRAVLRWAVYCKVGQRPTLST